MELSSKLLYTVPIAILTVQFTASFQLLPVPDEFETFAYGDNCTQETSCNTTDDQYLECYFSWGPDSGRCRCQGQMDAQMIHLDKCRFTIGTDCPLDSEDECVPKADCTNGTCKCRDGYYGNQNASICWTSWNFTCSPDHDIEIGICNSLHGLYCNNITNVCECAEADHEWSDKFNHCVSATRHGDPCEPTSVAQDCAQNLNPFMECTTSNRCACRGEADLDMVFIEDKCLATRAKTCGDGQTCIYNSHCQADLCTCDTGYTDNGPIKFMCSPGWGMPCTQEFNYTVGLCDSSTGLHCAEDKGVCQCSDEGNWDEWRDDTCSPVIGGSCEEDGDTCPPASDCINKWSFQTCECMTGYSQTKENHCKLGRGSTCLANPDPARPELECNDGLLLTCSDGKCACDGNSVYEPISNRCRVRLGSPCDYDQYGALDRLCVLRSECVREASSNSTTVGVCVCAVGKTPSEDRTTCGGSFLSGSLMVMVPAVVFKITQMFGF